MCKCDMFVLEDIRHILMQCRFFQDERNRMHDNTNAINPVISRAIEQCPTNTLPWLLGKPMNGVRWDDLIRPGGVGGVRTYYKWHV